MESKHSDWRAVKLEVPQIVGVILQGVRQECGTGGALLWEDAPSWSLLSTIPMSPVLHSLSCLPTAPFLLPFSSPPSSIRFAMSPTECETFTSPSRCSHCGYNNMQQFSKCMIIEYFTWFPEKVIVLFKICYRIYGFIFPKTALTNHVHC